VTIDNGGSYGHHQPKARKRSSTTLILQDGKRKLCMVRLNDVADKVLHIEVGQMVPYENLNRARPHLNADLVQRSWAA
jgi:hypothetical protein